MTAELKVILGIAAGLAIGYGLGIYAKRDCRRNDGRESQIDTIYRIDTITRLKPLETAKFTRDTMLVELRDTVTLRDTVFVRLPREVKVYEDSLYRAVVSGYRPSLDTMDIYCRQTTITKTVEGRSRPRWAVGVQGGVGASREGISPYIGVGIQFNLFSW